MPDRGRPSRDWPLAHEAAPAIVAALLDAALSDTERLRLLEEVGRCDSFSDMSRWAKERLTQGFDVVRRAGLIDAAQEMGDVHVICRFDGHYAHMPALLTDAKAGCPDCGGPLYYCRGKEAADELCNILDAYTWRFHAIAAWLIRPEGVEVDREAGDGEGHLGLKELARAAFPFRSVDDAFPAWFRCRFCRVGDHVADLRAEVTRLASDRGCVTCPWRIAVPRLAGGWGTEILNTAGEQRKTERAQTLVRAGKAHVTALEAEVRRLRALVGEADPGRIRGAGEKEELIGVEVEARCGKCGAEFTASDGGAFFYRLLRCDRCGATKSVSFDDLGDLFLGYIKGLPGPYSSASATRDQWVRDNYAGEAIPEEAYRRGVEQFTGHCECGGAFTFDAPRRCPECRSTDVELGDIIRFRD